MAERIRKTLEWTPWLVALSDDQVVGYAYASRHRERAGYRWSVDISVYVDAAHHRRGVGRQLYAELLAILKRQGFVNAYAGITTPNPASVALHEQLGMVPIATYEEVGYKFGQWLPVTWFQMRLQDPARPPAEPIPFPELSAE
jgi:phosphinothricin acetyltransferase